MKYTQRYYWRKMSSCLKSMIYLLSIITLTVMVGDKIVSIKTDCVRITLLILVGIVYIFSVYKFIFHWDKLFESKDPYKGL